MSLGQGEVTPRWLEGGSRSRVGGAGAWTRGCGRGREGGGQVPGLEQRQSGLDWWEPGVRCDSERRIQQHFLAVSGLGPGMNSRPVS